MQTLQTELVKHQNLMIKLRPESKLTPAVAKEKKMEYPNTASRTRNARYKRTSSEVAADVQKVDNMVATGKYHVIEALEQVGLKSSVYYRFHREQGTQAAHTKKPKQFPKKYAVAPKTEQQAPVQSENNFEQRKEQAIKQVKEERRQTDRRNSNEIALRKELEELRSKYAKLSEHIINTEILAQ